MTIKKYFQASLALFTMLVLFTVFGLSAHAVDKFPPDVLPDSPTPLWVDPDGRLPIDFKTFNDAQQVSSSFYIDEIYRTVLGERISTVVVIANSDIRPGIQGALDQYIADLEDEGYFVALYDSHGGEPADLKAFLVTQHAISEPSLAGVLFIGQLPVQWYEMEDDFSGHSEFPIDLYYMDLDGSWEDLDEDGVLDFHTAGVGDQAPDIWVGRLAAGVLDGNEVELLNRYFAKNHRYRNGELQGNGRALVYVDDDWVPWTQEYVDALSLAYDDVVAISDKATTIADDYRTRLVEENEWIQLHAHSSAFSHSFEINDTWGGGIVTNDDIRNIGPTALFYNLFCCSGARYVEHNYLGGWYLFSEGNGLAVIGSSKTGSMLDFGAFYAPFGNGRTIGESFRLWFERQAPYDLTDRQWFYGMTLLADPTLRQIRERPVNDAFKDAIELSGISGSIEGTNVAATAELGETQHAGVPVSASVWWQWTASFSGQTTFDTFGSDFDTVLAVYVGDAVDALAEVASNDDTDSLQSRVNFTATAGTRYSIAVDGFAGRTGDITLSWSGPEIQVINIDVKPGNKRNIINTCKKGRIWVAILSDTDPESPFAPASQIDIPTVGFGPNGAKAFRYKVRDVNKDGLGDLLLHFIIPETGITYGDTEATIIGETFNGQSFTGTDTIKTIGCKAKVHKEKKHYEKHHHKNHYNGKYH